MDTDNVSLLVAFGAGTLSFASPCCLPLVPVYMGHIAGVAVARRPDTAAWRDMGHALAFVAGFSLVFIGIWASLGLVGSLFLGYIPYLRQVGGAILIFMGLHLLGIINIGILNREFSLRGAGPSRNGIGPSFALGIIFAAGWTPCLGPVLGSIIGLASARDSLGEGTLLLVAYSAGLGVPFLATAMAVDTVTGWLRRMRPAMFSVQLISGALVVAIGVLMVTNALVRLPSYFSWANSWY